MALLHMEVERLNDLRHDALVEHPVMSAALYSSTATERNASSRWRGSRSWAPSRFAHSLAVWLEPVDVTPPPAPAWAPRCMR